MVLIENEIKSLTALRGIACLLVLVSHLGNEGYFWNIRGTGQLGVMLFFSLSGFLMLVRYSHVCVVVGWLKYYLSRFFRVYPVYVIVLLVVFFLHQYTSVETGFKMGEKALIRHLSLQGNQRVMWTIPIEAKFYLIFPFIATFLFFLRKYSHFLGLVFLSGGWVLFAFYANPGHSKVIALTNYMAFFLSGMTFGFLFTSYNSQLNHLREIAFIMVLLLFCTIIICIPPVFVRLWGEKHGMWEHAFAFSLLMGMLVVFTALSEETFSRFNNKFWILLGEISYSLYLTHSIVMESIIDMQLDMHVIFQFIFILCAVFIVAYLTYTFVEKPFIRLGKAINSRL